MNAMVYGAAIALQTPRLQPTSRIKQEPESKPKFSHVKVVVPRWFVVRVSPSCSMRKAKQKETLPKIPPQVSEKAIDVMHDAHGCKLHV